MLGTRLPAAGIDEGLLSPGSRPAVLSLAPETSTSLHCDGHATDGAAAWPDPAKTDITYRAAVTHITTETELLFQAYAYASVCNFHLRYTSG